MKTSSSNLKRLSPKDFNAALLEELTRQGRVFIAYPQEQQKDAYKREVLDYVQQIDDYVTDAWRQEIDELWQQIVDSPCFADCLAMKRGVQAGHMNRYTVTNIVCIMHNRGVYRSEVSLQELHMRMEETSERNKYFLSSGNYALPNQPRAYLKQLLRRV